MQIMLVTYTLNGPTDAEYRAGCEGEAALFAGIPGCASKVWLGNDGKGTYGAIYTFDDERSADTYRQSDLFKTVLADKTIANISLQTFGVLDGPTRTTTRRA
jgi:Putative mono-oxygenase ydhR